jgi:multidrug efflux pump subunit AcrB
VNISGPFIARPVATSLLAIAVLLAGILGYMALPVSSLPQVSFPTIEVVTKLPGASPNTVSRLITAPLERQFGEIAGLAAMSSVSGENTSAITLRFDLSVPLSTAAQDVQAAINAAAGELPPNLQYPPVYREVNPADAPILTLALTSHTLPLYAVANIAQTSFLQKLSEIRGVGEVTIAGGLRKALRINVNPLRLAAYGLSLEDVRTAVVNANQAGATGGLQGPDKAYAIGTNDQMTLIRQYARLPIAYRNGAPVTIGAVGHVRAGLENSQELADYNGVPAVILSVHRSPGANIVSTVARVEGALRELRSTLPHGVRLDVVANRTGTIKASVADVQLTLLAAMFLVVLVIFLFLPNPRATFIPAVALPLSIIGTFAVMYGLGYQLDNLSLMALTVATGFVVDDAIVMIENIVRFVEAGEPPLRAAYMGARQIGFTIVSLTVSLVAVFIPLLFMSGVVGRLFSEFAVTLSVAVVVSAVVSLTLTPMMGARLLKPASEVRPNRAARAAEALLARTRDAYRRGLHWCLRHQRFMLIVFAGTVVLTVVLFDVVPKALLPEVDTGEIVAVTEGAQSLSLGAMARLQNRAVSVIRRNPAVSGVTSLIGAGATNPAPNTGRLTIVLKPIGHRPGINTVVRTLQHSLKRVPGLRFYMQPVQDITLSSRISPAEYQYTLTGTGNRQLRTWSARIERAMRALPELRDVSSNQEDRGLEAYIHVNRTAAARLGVSMSSVQNILYDAFGQRQISTIYTSNAQYRVVLGVGSRWARSPAALETIYVPSGGVSTTSVSSQGPGSAVSGNSTLSFGASSSTPSPEIPLGEIARITVRHGPLTITRENQFPAVTLSFNTAPGVSLGAAESAIRRAERSLHVPASVQGTFSGAAAEFEKSLVDEPWLILAAVVVIYIVLGVLYESPIHPITILSTLPSAGVGALLALMMTGTPFTIVALVGIILLMGIVKKNGIIMVDFAIAAERERGLAPSEAITEAALLRFRPIMMTTLAALLGAVPLVLEGGSGWELRVPLGITIIGGLLLSQVLTLFTTPVVYLALDRLHHRAVPASAAAIQPAG